MVSVGSALEKQRGSPVRCISLCVLEENSRMFSRTNLYGAGFEGRGTHLTNLSFVFDIDFIRTDLR